MPSMEQSQIIKNKTCEHIALHTQCYAGMLNHMDLFLSKVSFDAGINF